MSQLGVDSLQQLDGVGVKEVFEQDPRPTFVLDLDPDDLKTSSSDALDFLFCNEALRSHHVLLDSITIDTNDASQSEAEKKSSEAFRRWARSVTKFDDSRDVYPFTYLFHNMLWTGSTIRKRWRVISGNQFFQSSDLSSPMETITEGQKAAPVSRTDFGLLSTLNKNQSAVAATHAMAPTTPSKPSDSNTKSLANGQPTNPSPDEATPKRIGFSSRSSTGTGKTSEATLLLNLTSPDSSTSDWTVAKPKGFLSEHHIFARSIDWASTPLGAMKTWSRELRQAACLVMSNPHPSALFWGSDLTLLYNEAYKNEVAGNKHPSLMGTGAEGPFREVWETVSPIFVECARTGKSVRRDNDYLPLERAGYVEECYFSWSFTPLYAGGRSITGFYNAPFETTRDIINRRRMHTLQRLGATIATAKSVKEFWQQILAGLEDNHYDVPFALLYSVLDSDDADELSTASGSTLSLKSCILEGSIAVPDGHAASSSRLDLKRSREGFIPSFREAMRTREPTRLQVRDGSLPESLLDGIEWRGFGEPCKDAIIFPIRPTNGDSVLAFLLLGINPRRAYDDDYEAFAKLMNRQLATALASVLLFEEEMRSTQNAIVAAVLQQEQLNEQLAIQTNRLQRMTALSPLGMFYVNPEGLILEANDRYYEMTGQDRDDLRAMSWMDQLVESSKPVMIDGWHKLSVDLIPWTSELQLKAKRFDPINADAELIENWVLASSQPELGPDGSIRSVMGSITDISHLKWAQGLQERRIKEAEERRRQQNEFIDITSHEMRNPLSAILQCADDISSTLAEYQARNPGEAGALIKSCVESANTIALCVQHQKSIVDDILTVSKLDSNLLQLAPVQSQPLDVAKGVMKMFESELLAKRIKSSFIVSPDYGELNVESVSMDPSRVSQILINLMTNAIKFTNDRAVREIRMYIGASLDPPNNPNTKNFQYVPRRNNTPSVALGQDWNSGECLYIRLKVEDTGCGLTQDEIQLLFERFQQASPRTHAQYGGSGLGLFISRQLTELHGGQIGVSSEAGNGSTFGFYFRARRLSPPKKADQLLSPIATRPSLVSTNSYRSSTPNFITSHIEKEMKSSSSSFEPPAASVTEQTKPETSSSLYILVVEDNLVNQRVLMKQLQKAGAVVSVADNGKKALDYLETTEFFHSGEGSQRLSVVLMDLEMPVMDGLTCVRHIRQLEKEGVIERHVPVIAVTANVRLEQVLAAREAGMDEVVSKPFRIPELLTKINVLLSEGNS